ncbi:unnamed protein product (macronuclear) [Paramecium tetraurelia]|uniref:Uncharacterized protein n=1 Tax=Paramecium tetraurelia TaxID=5888 RepID=A0BPE5_PARTE|nr:uncharacterized protein GSPATT00005161001 [Paramecium tetraurelia]CAK60412.1 unnamed protein product [Paramecium tetraurelia]|eukprot:XP_001427810.1 hypothetical protein (macronuclear) [Paramecium tetraurelia strain d4-2]
MTFKTLMVLLLVTMAVATESPAIEKLRNKLDQNEYNSQLVDLLELSLAGGQLDRVFELLQKMVDDLTGQINAANLDHASRMAAFESSIEQLEANLATLSSEVQTNNRKIGDITQAISTLTSTSVAVKKQLETINQREEQIRDNRQREIQVLETKQSAGSRILAALEDIHDRLVKAVLSNTGSFLEEAEKKEMIKQVKKELGRTHPLALLLEFSSKFDEATAKRAIELIEQIIASIKEGEVNRESNQTAVEENFNSLVNEVTVVRDKLQQDNQKTTSALKNRQNDLKITQRRNKQLEQNEATTQQLLETTRVQKDLYDSNFRSNASKREGQLNSLKTALQILRDNEQALKK